MSSTQTKIVFATALLLLILSGIAAGFVIVRLYRAESQIRHTYDVEVAIGDFESALTEVGRTRVAYINSGAPESLKGFEVAVSRVGSALARIRQLTSDNQAQQALADRLELNANQRVSPSQQSVRLKQQDQSDPQKQLQLTFAVAQSAFDTAAITQQMRRNEDNLLEQRSNLSERLFTTIAGILSVSFLLSACMFWLHYRMLNRELRERTGAENHLRQLSLELMRVQDEQHKRFARELHDGLGQTLAGTKMMVDTLATGNPADPLIAELATLLDDALTQTRTISYLFHPPFLDEIGFVSAAKWLVDGYAQHTGVAVSTDFSQPQERLPRSLELTLYRVLQESLNNIHRHSKSVRAEVNIQADTDYVTLRIRDYGQGIPNDTLAAFHANGKQAGVGLTSMRERVMEQGGKLDVRSDGTGTEIIAKLPIGVYSESAESAPSRSVV